jgi:hypothetical protein
MTLHEDCCAFMTISRSILHSMRNISDKICRKNQNTFYIQKFSLKIVLLKSGRNGTGRHATEKMQFAC